MRLHVVKYRRDGGLALRAVFAPQLHRAARAHDGFVARDPLGVGRARQHDERTQQAEPDGAHAVERCMSGSRMVAIMRACVKLARRVA